MKNGLIINKDGFKRWYKNDLLHHEIYPAAEYENGNKLWYQHGELHRENGPAIELFNGTKEWWYKGIQYTEQEFNAFKLDMVLSKKEQIIKKYKI